MKRFLLVLVLILAPVSALAQFRASDVLMTDDGALFSVETVLTSDYNREVRTPIDTTSVRILRLRIQQNGETSEFVVPASLKGGSHIEPSLAYDAEDARLYIFWQNIPNLMSSELLFASVKDGVWSDVSTFDNGIWRIRFNLKVAITHYVQVSEPDGTRTLAPAMIAHAIWWEQNGWRESARYAMLELDRGAVRYVQVSDLSDFVTGANPEPYALPEVYDKRIFRTPFIFETPDSSSVDMLFANWSTNRYSLLKIRPVLDDKNGVLHIPIGVTQGEMDPPQFVPRYEDAGFSAMRSASGTSRIVIYSSSSTALDYVVYHKGAWDVQRTFVIGKTSTTMDQALDALRRFVSHD
jgi:hypothetical protein